MTEPMDEAALRNWLVDYLVTNVGCNPEGSRRRGVDERPGRRFA